MKGLSYAVNHFLFRIKRSGRLQAAPIFSQSVERETKKIKRPYWATTVFLSDDFII